MALIRLCICAGAYELADLRLCWSHIPHCWKSHALAQIAISSHSSDFNENVEESEELVYTAAEGMWFRTGLVIYFQIDCSFHTVDSSRRVDSY